MANVDNPRGLQIFGPLLSCRMYKMGAAYAQNLFVGDPMVLNNQGNAIIATAGTGNAILGAALGFFTPDFAPLATSYHPTGTAGQNHVLIADDPRQLYIMQEDGVGGSYWAITDQGGNANIINNGSGSTFSGMSTWELNSSDTPGNTAGDQIRIISAYRSVDNEVGIDAARWIIRINNHQGLQGIVGVGI